jgi:hemolysin activation/secretion protein
LFAQVPAGVAEQELQRQQERERQRAAQDAQRPDVRLMADDLKLPSVYPLDEAPCWTVRRTVLEGEEASDFSWALRAADDAVGRCLGSQGMNVLIGKVQNALVKAGFVTTRVLAPTQDLRGGTVTLVLVPGRIRAIRSEDPARATSTWNVFPAGPGDLLNLRDIEQALENYKRVPTADANIEIAAGERPGESDLAVKWAQQRRLRFNLSADDSGSDNSGKYQGGATVSVDNPLGVQDLFYVSFNHHLYGAAQPGDNGTRGTTVHYSVPLRYWLLSLQANDYRYHQTVAGATEAYLYSGTSRSAEAKLSRLVYRDASRKTTVSLQGYSRRSNNFIDDTEVEVQRRRTGGFTLALAHQEFVGDLTIDASLAYKRGTSAFGSLRAPEEAFGEGTSRPVLINADASLAWPITKRLHYKASWRAQWNRTALTPQDLFAIGGRYTVRGFDGESSLVAERGASIRNDLSWMATASQQLYLGVDAARVSGPGASRLVGTSLSGFALGLRGQIMDVQYDLSVGKPLHKPVGFQTAAYARAFSLNYGF